ncbi:MAG: KH domain-containing protein, partial [Spirochaetia bacterium]
VPHSVYVEVADMEVRKTEGKGEDLLWIRAFLLVERESQKGILVGKAGAKIKMIRTTAQKEIAELFPYRIHLDLRVKVDPKWRRKEGLLQRLVN